MPRHRFGADLTAVLWRTVTLADGTLDVLQLARGAGPITAWNAEVGGAQITDLQNAVGVPLAGGTITADTNGWVDLLGPDGVAEMWLDAGVLLDGAAARQRIVASDLGPTVLLNAETLAAHTAQLASLATRADALEAGRGREVAFTIGTLAVGVGTFRWYNNTGRTLTIVAVRASVGTAPSGGSLLVDVNRSGTTIYTTQSGRPSIPAGQNTSGRVTAHNVTTVGPNDYLTVDIDTSTATALGANLAVQVELVG